MTHGGEAGKKGPGCRWQWLRDVVGYWVTTGIIRTMRRGFLEIELHRFHPRSSPLHVVVPRTRNGRIQFQREVHDRVRVSF
jgi:hypothetical protein